MTRLAALEQRPRWATPDAAIREAVMSSPLRARGIDYARVPTTGDGAEVALYAVSWVLAILGDFDQRTQAVLVGSAMGLSFREIAAQARDAGVDALSATTCRRLHRPAWDYVRARLIELGLLEGH